MPNATPVPMKLLTRKPVGSGFTLLELMVAMAITSIIVAVLVSVTATAVDTWSRGRTELRAARQAKAMVDAMAGDFEALVTRPTAGYEWLSASCELPNGGSTNATTLVFFTATSDRYKGQVGDPNYDIGGDVSCVGYKLLFKDPIDGGASVSYPTFVLNRLLISPKMGTPSSQQPGAYELLGSTDLMSAFNTRNSSFPTTEQLEGDQNFLCENIFQFTVTFHVLLSTGENRLVSIGNNTANSKTRFRIFGDKLTTDPVDATLETGAVTAVEVSLSVITDSGMDLLRKKESLAEDPAWVVKNTYNYSKLIQLPRK